MEAVVEFIRYLSDSDNLKNVSPQQTVTGKGHVDNLFELHVFQPATLYDAVLRFIH